VKLLALLLRASRGVLVLAILCGLLSGAGNAVLVSLINQALSEGPTHALALRFAGLGVGVLVLRIATQVLLGHIQQGALYRLRTQLARRFLATPLRGIEEAGPHRLQSHLTSDVLKVSVGLSLVPHLLINAAIMAGCLGYMAWLSPPLFLALVAVMTLGMLTYLLPTRRAMGLMRQSRETYEDMMKQFNALTHGVKELKLHARRREVFLQEQLDRATDTLRSLDLRTSTLDAVGSSWGLSLFFALIGLLLFVLPGGGGKEALTGYVLTLLYMQQPLDTLLNSFQTVGQGAIALQQLETLPLAPLEVKDTPGDGQPAPLSSFEEVRLEGVTHTYHREQEDASFTLGPIDLRLRRGELVFLVGGNGSGKTSLAKLLVGLYVPESGRIVLDGIPVTDDNRERYRQCISSVFSDFYLFERLHGLSSPHLLERAREYLTLLHLERKVSIDERGGLSTTQLSMGQRKRLALLVSYLEDRPCYVFDEWAADQDPLFREVFYLRLLPDLREQGKAVLVISHDDRYFHVADRIIRLEAGQLAPDVPPSRRLAAGDTRAWPPCASRPWRCSGTSTPRSARRGSSSSAATASCTRACRTPRRSCGARASSSRCSWRTCGPRAAGGASWSAVSRTRRWSGCAGRSPSSATTTTTTRPCCAGTWTECSRASGRICSCATRSCARWPSSRMAWASPRCCSTRPSRCVTSTRIPR
jgi:putative ATP-binding cassette transporter